MKKNVKRKKGFTLIEILIVISIIAVLAAIAVPKYTSIQKDAKVKADIASAKVIADATTALIAQDKITKTDYTDGVVLDNLATTVPDNVITNYLQSVPVVKAVTGVFKVTINATTDNVTVAVVSTDPEGTFTLYPTVANYPNVADTTD